MAKNDKPHADAHERLTGILTRARVDGGWIDEDIADRILLDLGLDHDGKPVGGEQRPAADEVAIPPAPQTPTVAQPSPFQAPVQAPNPAVSPPPADMLGQPGPNDPQPEQRAAAQAPAPPESTPDEHKHDPGQDDAPDDAEPEHGRRGHKGRDHRK